MENLIHIVFDAAGAESLRQSFALDDIISGEVLHFEDDLAFGPLDAVSPPAEESGRQHWWEHITGETPYEKTAADAGKLTDLTQRMREDENNEIWIWAAQNARDVSGYYALLGPLQDFTGRVHLIYLNNLPFINEKGGLFYPVSLGEVPPREFLKARKLAREITPAEVEVDGEEWTRLCAEQGMVRILEGGKKLRSEPADYFDQDLVNRCRFEPVKGWRLVSQFRQKAGCHTDETFLFHRLASLVEAGRLVAKEGYKTLRDAELKAAGSGEEVQTQSENTQDAADE